MALVIDVGVDGWMSDAELRDAVLAHWPEADVRTRAEMGDPAGIRMAAVARLAPDLPAMLPNLEVVQKLGAGVDTILSHPGLPDHVRVTRLKPQAPAREIAEWVLTYILQAQRHVRAHRAAQDRRAWTPIAPREAHDTTVAVLGLGHIGGHTARLMAHMGFRVLGWSRSPRSLPGVDCRHGDAALSAMLPECDHVAAILPSTPRTRDLFDAHRLAAMKPGATLLNAGRGDLIDEAALVAALDRGTPGHAVLDVTRTEPLPGDSPLWSHPGVTITPHVSGWHLGDALADVAENLRRLTTGAPLLHKVDRAEGY